MKKVVRIIAVAVCLSIPSLSQAITQPEADQFIADLQSKIISRDVDGIIATLEDDMQMFMGSLSTEPIFNRESYRAYTIEALKKIQKYDYKILSSILNTVEEGYTLDLKIYEESVIDGQSYSHTIDERIWLNDHNGKISVSKILFLNRY